jgi:hypothetical protein
MSYVSSHRLLVSLVVLWAAVVHSADPAPGELDVEVLGEELSITHYAGDGNGLFLWVAPGYGSHERARSVARALAQDGTEVWHVDLADNLFLPKSTSTMRALDG